MIVLLAWYVSPDEWNFNMATSYGVCNDIFALLFDVSTVCEASLAEYRRSGF